MFALRAKEKLLALERKDREKKEKKALDRKKELQKYHAGLSQGDPRLGVVKNPSTAAKRNAKYIGTFSVQQNEPDLETIKQLVTQQVNRIDFQQPPSLLPVALLVSVEGVKVLSEDGKRLIMAHALKRILFAMVNDKHTAFILVARNPDSPPDLCHCHIFMAKSQTEARDINELVGKAFKLAFANKHQKKQKEKKHKKEASHTSQETDLDKTPSSASCVNNSVNHGSNSSHHNSSQIHDPQQFRIVEERQLKETIDRLDEELLKLNIENFDLESYFNAYERDKGSEQYLKALTTYETNRRVIHQKSIILERMQSQYRQLISNNNENLTANRNSNNVLVPPPIPKKKSPRSRTPSPVNCNDEQLPPPLPPKPYHASSNGNDLPPPIPHKHTCHPVNDTTAAAPMPITNHGLIPGPCERPISQDDRRLRTLTPKDAPIPPGYEVWEPEFLGQPNGNTDSNDFVLKDAEWFQSGIPREIAEEILRQEGEGSFIVRSSQSNPDCYALSMKGPKGNILNFLIEEDSKGVYFQGDDAVVFPSLVGLIVHHSVIPGILPCPLAVTKSNPLFNVEDNSSDEEDPDYRTRSEILKLFS